VIGYRWDGTRCRLFFRIVPDSYNEVKLIDFLVQLRKEFHHKRLILLWDGLPSHRSRQMTAYLDSQRKWLSVVRLPGYAPELNPVEGVWANIQGKVRIPLKKAACSENRKPLTHSPDPLQPTMSRWLF